MKKFKLTSNTNVIKHPITNKDVTLYQIESLKDFKLINEKDIKVGDLGGWLEKKSNLSQEGLCWIYDNCQMFDNSYRSENSIGYGNSKQFGNSHQSGDSRQSGNSRQFGYSMQFGDSKQFGNSHQSGDSMQSGNSRQYGYSQQYGYSKQCEHSEQSGYSIMMSDMIHSSGQCLSFTTIYNLTLSDNHIKYGCEVRTISEWEKFLESDEVIETSRDDPKFKILENTLRCVIFMHKNN